MKNDDPQDRFGEQRERELFSKLSVNHSREKEDVWAAIEQNLDNGPSKKPKRRPLRPWAIGVAASVSLLICVGLFARFYTIQIEVKAGETAKHILPDGSVIHINSASFVNYPQYWWAFSREINLEGEAFFEVEKGAKFQVKSPQGTTQVLGTSFNIYARNQSYQVFCATGKVKVETSTAEEVTLSPNQFVELTEEGLIKQENNKKKEEILSWLTGRFIYNTTPLRKVLQDFERYYGTRLIVNIENLDEYFYTGLFNRSIPLEKALEVVCYSFDLTLEKKSDETFMITEN